MKVDLEVVDAEPGQGGEHLGEPGGGACMGDVQGAQLLVPVATGGGVADQPVGMLGGQPAAHFKPVDYWAWAPELDLISNDHYLLGEDPLAHVDLALAADLSRSLAGGC
jgi:hypothetical protein